jgi:hypothetical protein
MVKIHVLADRRKIGAYKKQKQTIGKNKKFT